MSYSFHWAISSGHIFSSRFLKRPASSKASVSTPSPCGGYRLYCPESQSLVESSSPKLSCRWSRGARISPPGFNCGRRLWFRTFNASYFEQGGCSVGWGSSGHASTRSAVVAGFSCTVLSCPPARTRTSAASKNDDPSENPVLHMSLMWVDEVPPWGLVKGHKTTRSQHQGPGDPSDIDLSGMTTSGHLLVSHEDFQAWWQRGTYGVHVLCLYWTLSYLTVVEGRTDRYRKWTNLHAMILPFLTYPNS